MKNISIILLLAVLPHIMLGGPSGRKGDNEVISGTVREAGTGETLPGVQVKILGTENVVYTNRDGYFEIEIPKLEDAKLEISFVSFERTVLEASVLLLENPIIELKSR